MRHIVIIPTRNEAKNIENTLSSLIAQIEVPDRVYVVDDGSTDDTAQIVNKIAKQYPIISIIRKNDRGSRLMGSGVVESFNVAYDKCKTEEFTYISKIDADLILPLDYFEKILTFMDRHLDVGAASGIIYDKIGEKLVELRLPENHVPGALKTIRKKTFDEMGGFLPVLGWDIIDLVKIRSLGYKNVHLRELKVIHLRQHASAEGIHRGKSQWGKGAYIIGSNPLFVLARGVYRMFEPPYITGGIAFWWGYLKAACTRTERIADKDLIKALRREQLYRLIHFNKLPKHSSFKHPPALCD